MKGVRPPLSSGLHEPWADQEAEGRAGVAEIVTAGRSEEVLCQLDAGADELFPGLPNQTHPVAAVRMNGFAAADEWLLVFQVLNYGRPTGTFNEDWFVYGNRIETPGFVAGREAIEPAHGGDFWSDDPEERFLPDLAGFSVKLRGSVRDFSYGSSDLEAAGVAGFEMEPELVFVRTLAHFAADDILLAPEDLPGQFGRPNLPLVVRLDRWRLPDSMTDEAPSHLPCFQAVADSIAAAEQVGLDACGATANTHWSNWVEFE
jgi:hypothetical protein